MKSDFYCRLERRLSHFSCAHPVISFLLSFAGMPLILLLALSLSTAAAALPLGLLLGLL